MGCLVIPGVGFNYWGVEVKVFCADGEVVFIFSEFDEDVVEESGGDGGEGDPSNGKGDDNEAEELVNHLKRGGGRGHGWGVEELAWGGSNLTPGILGW